jgi:hypothetical protein
MHGATQDAGTAEAFKKVDLQYVEAAAVASKAAGVKHFSLVTAQGANAKVWASDWAIVHPLLYTRTKGLVSGQSQPAVVRRTSMMHDPVCASSTASAAHA